ncbi:hypothetical protein QN277_026743 [Acacia crassicarpa]|uniref:Secreted protein n=1 Tax=Acacia crassicarpa TaxID=499986 RepID=A0AAE1JAY5_9FABA|nr:hypothetical protein QN277_026743 [Acacia crassicarpa]
MVTLLLRLLNSALSLCFLPSLPVESHSSDRAGLCKSDSAKVDLAGVVSHFDFYPLLSSWCSINGLSFLHSKKQLAVIQY